MSFDYLIIGAGSAGCVLANKLSENPNNKVCLLEAGPRDNSMFISIPAGIVAMMRSNKRNWRYETTPQEALNQRQAYIPRGKTLGGSSAVNAMIYTRGHRWDYDHWESLGNKGWSWDEVLPYFLRSQNQERGASEYHGVGGPLNVADLRYHHPVSGAFIDACLEAGFPYSDDFNGAEQEGIGLYQVTQKDGKRWGVARGYLDTALERPNLTVITEAHVQRVLLDGKTVIGAEYEHKGQLHTVHAGETILSGGAINSPQILMLSGIGPKDELNQHGIPLQHELPGVGQNLQEHPDVLLVHRSLKKGSLSFSPASLGANLKSLYEYFRHYTGPLTSNAAEAGGFIKTDPALDKPDIQIHLTAALLDNHGLNLPFSMGHGFSTHVCVLRPKSVGSVTLNSADPKANAAINPRLLTHPEDVDTMLKGVKLMRKTILESRTLAPWLGEEVFPGPKAQTDEELLAFLREKADNIYHPVGTCKMGIDDMAVVEPEGLAVHGLQGLRVVDASIMPTLIGGNTNAPTVMIAEKAADAILAG
ncbi:MAG TPA: choline dehydrogenase [Alcanivoracaceae bacterium]|nr:choline dehydrogenase [Alcanivoracaceae bacterium]